MQGRQFFPEQHPTVRPARNHDKELESILAQLTSLDQQNIKLHSIADSIMKTSFLKTSEESPAIIMQYEEDMKSSFNMLIESIREFFISIDNKIRHLGLIVEKKLTESPGDLQRSTYPVQHPSKSHEHDRIDTLLARMGALEDNIKRTQDNEAKLMDIVQEMATRRGEYDEQPTIIRSSAKFNQHQYNQPEQEQKSHEKSFRLFSVHENAPEPVPTRAHPYSMVQSKTQQAPMIPIKLRQAPSKSTFGCLPEQSQVAYTGYPSVKRRGAMSNTNPSGWEPDVSNRNHRLTTLVKALKE